MNNCMQLEVIQYTKGHGARKRVAQSNEFNYEQSQLEVNDKLNLIAWRRGRNVPFFVSGKVAHFLLASFSFFFLSFLISFCLKLVFARHLTHLTMTPHSLGFSSLRLFLHPPRGPKSAALSTENVCRLGQHLRRLWKRPKRGLNGGPRAGSGSELAVINNIGAKKRTYDNLKYEIIYNY